MHEDAVNPKAVVYAEGLGFTEGPLALPDGTIMFTSVAGCLYTVAGSSVKTAASTGFGPTGLASDAAGTVFVVGCSGLFGAPDEVPGGVYRVASRGVEPVRVDSLEAPNDICFGPDGRLWFTDPGSDPRALFEASIPGRVCAYDLDSGFLEVLDDTGFYPNGLAFDDTGERLFVSESFSKRLVSYRVNGGRLTDKTLVAEFEATPDGMAIDVDHNIWQCVNPLDSILVVDPRGRLVERFFTGEGSYPSNCCFGGEGGSTLFVTTAGKGGIAAFAPGVSGLPLYPFR
jgi:gluconolactonase